MLLNHNSYDEYSFREWFVNTDIYRKLEKDADYISWKKHLPEYSGSLENTSRWFWTSRIFSLSSFYYLKFITDKASNDDLIYDIGCGSNWFKKYIPNIVGLDHNINPKTIFLADQEEVFDTDWLKNRAKKFNYAFSICALHFIKLSSISERVDDFISIIKDGGIGYLALNSARMVEIETPEKLMELFGNTNPSTSDVETYIRTELTDLSKKVKHLLCVDIDLTYNDEWMDGNIRLLFER